MKGTTKSEPGVSNAVVEVDKPDKLPYPKPVIFIVVTEFCERFAYYGMRAVLTIYMRNKLNFSDDLSTTIYHVFLFLCYFLPLFGAILADSFLGKYRTVLALSSIFAVGNLLLTFAATPPLHLPTASLSLFGLFLMAVGTGGIKPCVVALGGDQFKVPEQEKQLKQFFSIFLFAVSVGNMFSTVLTPVLRRDVQCFGDDCYPLAFGVPSALMIFAIGIFVLGKPLYKINKPKENIILRVAKCMTHAFSRERKLRKSGKSTEEKKHWVDYASYEGSPYDAQLIQDTKGLLRVLVYYLPIPMFWALYEQLGSRWTLQATRMDGSFLGYIIKPDQMQVTNAVLMFTFIPIFESMLLPLCRRCNVLKRPLQRMVVGGLLASSSFALAGYTELRIQKHMGHLANDGYLNVVNTLPAHLHIICNKSSVSSVTIGSYSNYYLHPNNCSSPTVHVVPPSSILPNASSPDVSLILLYPSLLEKFQSILVASPTPLDPKSYKIITPDGSDDLTKSKQGNSKLIVYNLIGEGNIENGRKLTLRGNGHSFGLVSGEIPTKLDVPPGKYTLEWSEPPDDRNTSILFNLPVLEFRTGGNYMVTLTSASEKIKVQVLNLVPPNEISILWQLPQYLLMAWAEILFIISGMEFSFTEAPLSMKSVLQSCWHLTNATGNLMVILATQLKGDLSQSSEFLIFSILMVIDAIIMALMSRKYRYVSHEPEKASLEKAESRRGIEVDRDSGPNLKPGRLAAADEDQIVRDTRL